MSLYFISNLIFAQNTPTELFETPKKGTRTAAVELTTCEKRAGILKISSNLNSGARLKSTSELTLNLFDDVSIPVKFDPVKVNNYKGLEVYRGRSNDKKFAHLAHYHDVVMVYNPASGKMVLQINTTNSFYEIRPTNSKGDYRVSEWTEEAAVCENAAFIENNAVAATSGCEEKDAGGKFVADLFVGYSYEAAAKAGDIDAHALSLVEMVNNGLHNSLVDNVYVRLVGTGIDSHNPGIVTSVLSDVYTWFADDIARTNPDFVASIQVPTGAPNEMGGWAGVGGYSSVNSINGSAEVFRHELGHNMGSNHCTPGIRPYASGYNNGNSKTHLCGNSVNFYSTPLVVDNLGLPLGDAATADNARLWRERAPEVTSKRIHSIKYDENDFECVNTFTNGTYHIKNVNSGKYLGTAGGSTASGTNLVLADSSANTRWNIFGIGENKFKIDMFQNANRSIDVPGGSSNTGTRLIVWSVQNSSNQKFQLNDLGGGNYNIKAFNSLCFQVENNATVNGSFIVQNNCTGMTSGDWQLIPVNLNKLNLQVTTVDVSCFGASNGSATVTATGGSGNYTYSWSSGGTGNSVTNLSPGSYTVTVSDGTNSIPYAFVIKQNDKFSISLNTHQSDQNMNGSVKALVSGGTAPYTFQWSNGASGDTISQLSPGVYTLNVTDQTNCSYLKEFFIGCSVKNTPCDDGNHNTLGDAWDENCHCAGIPVTCTLGRENIALGKPSSQVSTYSGAGAGRANDGNRNGNFNSGSVSHTDALAPHDWWEVDLGTVTKITDAVIYNRTDCCQSRMDSIYVFISTTPFASNDFATTLVTPGIKKIKLYGRKFSNVVISPDTLGRYFRVQNARYDATSLNIAEVEVYACGTPIITALTANPISGNVWELKGKIKRLGSAVPQLFVEHGNENFSISESVDITGLNLKDSAFVFKNVNIGSASSYQFRLKVVTSGGTFYSNEITFGINQNYCTPTVGSQVWYKTFNRMKYKGVETSYSTSVVYHDKTTITLDSLKMDSVYTMEFRTPDAGWTNLSYKIYIDLNDDKLFSGYNELVGKANPAGQWTTVTFRIPDTDLKTGIPLRMRLQGYESTKSTSCYGAVGNFADYTIVIKDGPCSAGGQISTLYPDTDGDGFGQSANSILGNCATNPGYVKNNLDFNDAEASIYPNAPDICDDKDNDNDGSIDEDGIPAIQNIILSNQIIPSGTQRASEKIQMGRNITIPSGNNVKFYALKNIELLPGTIVSNGSVFKAEIKLGCGQ